MLVVRVSLRLFLALCRYAPLFPGLTHFGDNTASLQIALSGKAKGELGHVARELFLKRAKQDWVFSVGHLPSEHNEVADCLSRLSEPGRLSVPPVELEGAAEVLVPQPSSLWVL